MLLICNYRPGVGGISGQVEVLQKMLAIEGHVADVFSTKASFLRRLLLPFLLRAKGNRYDIFHIHCCSGWGFLPAVVGITLGRWMRKRVVLTYHGGGGAFFFDHHPRWVRHFLTRTDANIVLSGFLAQVFDRHNLPYTIVPNIINLDDNLFRERDTLLPHFICTRAHEPLYNITCILRAFQLVQAKLPDATLTLVGDGSEHKHLVQQAEELGLHNVAVTGKADNKDIYSHLDRADIMLSAPTVDNMPVSLLEAMNAGLLVISSCVGGIPYMIEDNKTGLLFESDNPADLSRKMLWAVENPLAATALVRQARLAVSRYRWDNIKRPLYTAYGLPS